MRLPLAQRRRLMIKPAGDGGVELSFTPRAEHAARLSLLRRRLCRRRWQREELLRRRVRCRLVRLMARVLVGSLEEALGDAAGDRADARLASAWIHTRARAKHLTSRTRLAGGRCARYRCRRRRRCRGSSARCMSACCASFGTRAAIPAASCAAGRVGRARKERGGWRPARFGPPLTRRCARRCARRCGRARGRRGHRGGYARGARRHAPLRGGGAEGSRWRPWGGPIGGGSIRGRSIGGGSIGGGSIGGGGLCSLLLSDFYSFTASIDACCRHLST